MTTQLQQEGEHFVRFYYEDQLLAADVASYLSTALECGSAIIIATEQRIAAVRRHLEVLAPQTADKLIVLDAAATLESFLVDGWPDRTLFHAAVGSLVRAETGRNKTVRAYGEMVALLCAQGRYDGAIELEKLWNELAQTCTFSLFCAYGWNLFPTAELADSFRQICHQHGHASSDLQAPASDAKQGALKLLDLERKAMALDAEVARRKDAEQLAALREVDLADFLDNAAEGIHQVGPDGVILWANKAELQMLGYQWKEYVGRHVSHFHVDQALIQSILERLRKGETLCDQPALLRCQDGTVKHVLMHSNGCFMDGELRYTRCFTRDASERHALEKVNAEREALLKELMVANRNKDQFLAMLGHELRNPLSPILMALDLMEQRGDANCAGERNIIRRQASHLVRLVDDLLDVARVMQDKIELQQQNIALDAVIAHAAELARADIDRHRHHLALHVAPGLAVHADKVRLAQVLANLLTNAARYTPDGGSICVTATDDGAAIRIGVKDNGRGMAGPELERVFDLFYQGQRSLDRPEGGLGIGLSLVRRLVELHGGTVVATSAGLGRGSEFVVHLPAAAASGTVSSPAPLARSETSDASEPLNILLVDDNTDVADTLGEVLAARGHIVEVCNTPARALSVVGWFRPDIAILDIGLPGMNGYELAARVKAALGRRACRLIAQSGYGQQADISRSIGAGFECHLVKPVASAQLLALIEGRETGATH